MMTWTLSKKILIGYGIILTLLIIIFIWAILNLLDLGEASDAILEENYKSIIAAENMINALERQDSAILSLLLGYDTEGSRMFLGNEIEFLQWFTRSKENITISGEDKLIELIEKKYNSYLAAFSELKIIQKARRSQAELFYQEEIHPLFMSVREECVRLRDMNETTMFNASRRAHRIAHRAVWSMISVGIVAMGIGLIFSLILTGIIVKPVSQIMRATAKISKGEYNVEVSVNSSDELGQLATEFIKMAKKLKDFNDMNIEQIVAEKHKSESIIRSIDDGILVVDADLRITNINPTACEVLGVDLDRTSGKHFLEVVKNEELYRYVSQSIETGTLPIIDEGKDILTVKRDDSNRYYLFSIIPVYSDKEAMLSVVLLLRNITSLKEVDKLKSEFIMIASHELRTPLTSIVMSIDLLLESASPSLSERENQLLQSAHEELLRIKSLVNDLLDLSKIEAGKIEMTFEVVPVEVLFEKAVTVLKPQADERKIELTYEIADAIPSVKADTNKIVWVLTNLISNALRYTGEGGHINISADKGGPQVHINVKDDGVGIPHELQSRIFEKFVQIKTDRNAGGTGLGLAICREIVRAHGGTIWVDSFPGEGSTFTFTLPVGGE